MQTGGRWIGHFAAAAIVCCACVTTTALLASPLPVALTSRQAVVVVFGRSLIEHSLPAFMQIQPGRFVAARDVQRACESLKPRSDSLLLFLPDSGLCEEISAHGAVSLRERLHQLTGRWQVADQQQLGGHDWQFLAVAPPIDSSSQAMACSCPVNTPPTGSVSCAAQTQTAGRPIAPVLFVANDVDNDVLTGEFSYQRDADPIQGGLPTALTSSCTSGAGSLQCTVMGSAPAPAGNVQLVLSVNDGTATLPLSTLIDVVAPIADQIFADGFDLPACQ